jgi:hypothetical protein
VHLTALKEYTRRTHDWRARVLGSVGVGSINGDLVLGFDATGGGLAQCAAAVLGEDPADDLRSDPDMGAAAPVGLRNLGATCYVNSVLQCLAMNTPFCRALLALPPPPTATPTATDELTSADAMLYRLQQLFVQLTLGLNKVSAHLHVCVERWRRHRTPRSRPSAQHHPPYAVFHPWRGTSRERFFLTSLQYEFAHCLSQSRDVGKPCVVPAWALPVPVSGT